MVPDSWSRVRPRHLSWRHAPLVWLLVSPAQAEFPASRGGSPSDPYAYENYVFITSAEDPSQYPTNDRDGDDWKYRSKNACRLYGNVSPKCNPAAVADPQELHKVTGASIERAWETTTGRSDIIIAVHDPPPRYVERSGPRARPRRRRHQPREQQVTRFHMLMP